MIFSCPNCATRYQIGDASFPLAGRTVRCAKCSHTWHQQGPATVVPAPVPAPAPAAMIIACPECAARFQVDPTKFPASGRNVRCAKCQHVWHQTSPAAEVAAKPAPADSFVAAPPAPAFAAPTATSQTASNRSSSPTIEVLRNRAATTAHRAWEGRRSTAAIAIYAASFICLLSVGAWFTVHHHAGPAPSSSSAQPHAHAAAVKPGIELANVNYRRETSDMLGIMFYIDVTVTNRAEHELPMPKTIEVSLSDAGNHQLYRAAFPVSIKTLAGHKNAQFAARIYDAPKGAKHLQVSLGHP